MKKKTKNKKQKTHTLRVLGLINRSRPACHDGMARVVPRLAHTALRAVLAEEQDNWQMAFARNYHWSALVTCSLRISGYASTGPSFPDRLE